MPRVGRNQRGSSANSWGVLRGCLDAASASRLALPASAGRPTLSRSPPWPKITAGPRLANEGGYRLPNSPVAWCLLAAVGIAARRVPSGRGRRPTPGPRPRGRLDAPAFGRTMRVVGEAGRNRPARRPAIRSWEVAVDGGRFDAWTKRWATGGTRRGAVRHLAGGAALALLGPLGASRRAGAACEVGGRCESGDDCCRGERCTKKGRCACRGDRRPCVDRCCPEGEACEQGGCCVRPGGACDPTNDRCCETASCDAPGATEVELGQCCIRPGKRCNPDNDRCCPPSTCSDTAGGEPVCSDIG